MAAIKALQIDHVVLRVTDVPRACAWYAAVLGCTVERVLPTLGLTQLRAGASLIDLVDINGPAGKAGGAAAGRKRRNMDHFCVHGVVARRYGALGHGPSMYLTDPDGNTVELKGPPDADQTEKIADAIFKRRKKAR